MNIYHIRFTTISTIVLGLIFTLCSSHQFINNDDDDYAVENYMRYDDYTYDDSIKTRIKMHTDMKYALVVDIINIMILK